MKNRKILFIIENFDDEPLGIMHLMGILKKNGFETDIVLSKYENYLNKVMEYEPAIIAFTVTTGYERYYAGISREIKTLKPGIISVFGGPHATFFPEYIKTEGVDIISEGESEHAILDIVNNYDNPGMLKETANIHIKIDGKIYENSPRSLVEDLDSLPFPDRETLYKYNFSFYNKKKSFITGRGCPYKCSYCFNHIYHQIYKGKGKIIRRRSVDNVIKEMISVKNRYPFKFAHFVDDTFILDREWLEEFADKYPVQVGLPYTCNIRANLVTEKIVQLLKRSNCYSVSLAIESGNTEVRNKYLLRDLTDNQIIEACRMIKKYSLKLATQNILGLPGGNLKTDMDTVYLNHKCKPDYAWFTIYQPYPKTKLAETAYELNLFDKEDKDNISTSFHEDSILNIDNKLEVTNLHKLSGFAVEFPKFLWLIKMLIKLRFTYIYSIFRKIWNVYCYKYRLIPAVTVLDMLKKAFKPYFNSLKKFNFNS